MAGSFFQELKRRNVFRVAIAYVVTAWLLLQIADVLFGMLDVPGWAGRLLIGFLILGFPLAVFFAWAFELTPEGLKLESQVDRNESITPQTARSLNRIIILLLVLAVGYFSVDKFLVAPQREAELISRTTEAVETQSTETASGADGRSIAVLPFVNLSADPEQAFFSDGLSEELLNVLARLEGLRVAARTSSFSFKDKGMTASEIAGKLRVEHVLEGSVRKSGNRIRITAQLIKASDGFQLWSQTYDRELSDIFAIQEEIATAITGALRSHLGMTVEELVSEKALIKTANTQAYEAYLKGRQLIHRRGRQNLEEAVRVLERALRLDSKYAPAHAQLAIATILLTADPSTYGDLSIAEVNRRASPHIDLAIELAPNLSEAYGARCLLRSLQDRFEDATVDCEKAIALNPGNLDALNWAGNTYLELGRYQDVARINEEIFRRDPESIIGRFNYADLLYAQGRYEEADAIAESMMEDSPWAAYHTVGIHQVMTSGDLPNGIRNSLHAFALEPEDFGTIATLARAFAYLGLAEEASRLGDNLSYIVAFLSGDFAEAISVAEQNVKKDPETLNHRFDLAGALYRSGRIDESRVIYEALADRQGVTALRDPVYRYATPMARLAFARQQAGDVAGTEQLMTVLRTDLAMRQEAGLRDHSVLGLDAQIAALRNDPDNVIRGLNKAIGVGLREPGFLREPTFGSLSSDPRLLEIQQKLARILADQRAETLQMICFDNPVPEAWQPLPETCAGVIRQ